MHTWVVLLAALLAARPQSDTSLFIPREEMIRLYTDCDEDRWPYGTEETFAAKTTEEIVTGVARRRALEERWRFYFAERAGDSIVPTPLEAWAWPLAARGRLLDNFANPRENGAHEALDIFVRREGVTVRSPISGVVVAAGDGWRGGYTRSRGFHYEGDGLSRRAGNGVMIFDPASGGYLYLIHLEPGVLVHTGDIVRRGQRIGRVGHTGNAAYPRRGRHLHLAFKRAGTECGIEGVLVSENPFRRVLGARRRAFR
jgi:murein DD-endopeptidase MepM/ murein hydrolase activator NlpD